MFGTWVLEHGYCSTGNTLNFRNCLPRICLRTWALDRQTKLGVLNSLLKNRKTEEKSRENFTPPPCCCCSVVKLCLTFWDPLDCSPPGFLVLNYLAEFAQIHVHWVGIFSIFSSATLFSFCLQSFPASNSSLDWPKPWVLFSKVEMPLWEAHRMGAWAGGGQRPET